MGSNFGGGSQVRGRAVWDVDCWAAGCGIDRDAWALGAWVRGCDVGGAGGSDGGGVVGLVSE